MTLQVPDFSIKRGDIVLLSGESGTGKSTLLYRGFAECIDTWKMKRRVLPIYIDLSKCEALCSSDNNIQIEPLLLMN